MYQKEIEVGTKILGALVLAKAGKPKVASKFLASLKGEAKVDSFISSLTDVIKMISEGKDLEDMPEDENEDEENEDDEDDEDEIMNEMPSSDDEDEDEEDLEDMVEDLEDSGEISEATASILKGLKY